MLLKMCQLGLILIFLGANNCPDEGSDNISMSHPVFPGTLLINSDGLFVTSRNEALQYSSGALLSVGSSELTSKQDLESPKQAFEGLEIPSFALALTEVPDSNSRSFLFLTQELNHLHFVDSSSGKLVETSVRLPRNNPADILILTNGDTELTGLISYGSNGYLQNFSLTRGEFKLGREILLYEALLETKSSSTEKDPRKVKVIKSALLSKAKTGMLEDHVLLALEAPQSSEARKKNSLTALNPTDALLAKMVSYLVWMPVGSLISQKIPDQTQINKLDLSDMLGALHIVDLNLTDNSADDNLVTVLMQNSDLIANLAYEMETDDSGNQDLKFVSKHTVHATCENPVDLAVSNDLKMAYVACFNNDNFSPVVGHDLNSLETLVKNKKFGLGPTNLLVNKSGSSYSLFVSYNLDGSVGVFDLGSLEAPEMTPRMRLFPQTPRNIIGG